MTSKISFSKLIKIIIKNNVWSFAVSVAVLFFALPVQAGAYITRLSLFDNIFSKPELLHRLYLQNILLNGNGFALCMMIFCAMFNGMMGYRYLFNKSQCDLFHSLPIKRNELFITNAIAGVLSFAVPYVLFEISSVVIGAVKKIVYTSDILKICIFMILMIFAYAIIYMVVLLAVMLTGTAMCAGLATITLLGYSATIYGMRSILRSAYYATFTYGDADNVYSGPIELVTTFLGTFSAGAIDIKSIVISIVVFALLATLVLFLYEKREIERAGSSIAFRVIEPVVSVLILIPGAIYGGMASYEITSNGGNLWEKTSLADYGWMIFGIIITTVVLHFVIQTIFYADFKSLFKNLINPVIALVAVAVILSFYAFDLGGYDKNIPSYEQCAINSYSMESGVDYVNFDAQMDDDGYVYYWSDSETYRFDNMRLNKAQADEVIKLMLSDTEKYKQLARTDNDSDELTDTMAKYVDVTVRFYDKNNKQRHRNYHVNLSDNIELFNKLYSNPDYKKGVFPILTEDYLSAGDDLYIEDSLSSDLLLKAGDEKIKDFIETYKAELLEQDAYDMAASVPVASFYFTRKMPDPNANGYETTYNYNGGMIYPSFTKTLKKLEELGVDINRHKNVDNIKEITVNRYDFDIAPGERAYDEDVVVMSDDVLLPEDSEDTTTYTDKADIERIMDVVISDKFASFEPAFHPTENMDITVNYIEVPKDSYEYQTFVLEKGKTF